MKELPMNLQFFAEEGGDGSEQNDGDNNGGKESKTYTDEDVNQIVQKRLARASEEAQKQQAQAIEQAKTEALEQAKKEAQMTEEERAKEAFAKKENELKEREAKLAQQDALSATKQALLDEKLPVDFANLLADVDETKRKANIEAFKKSYGQSVQNAVEQRIKDQPNTHGSNGSSSNDDLGTQFAKTANGEHKKPAVDHWHNN